MILAVTGHRPDKLGGYDRKTFDRLCSLAEVWLREINPDLVLTGVALGWDSAVAEACTFLKLPYVAAVPFVGQDKKWRGPSKVAYRSYLERAQVVEVVCSGPYAPWKMLKRNQWMNDRADELLALYNGHRYGGTFHCVDDMTRRFPDKKIHNAWKDWTDATGQGPSEIPLPTPNREAEKN